MAMRRREGLFPFPVRANQGSSIPAGEPAVAIQTNEEMGGTGLQGKEMPKEVSVVLVSRLFGGACAEMSLTTPNGRR
eukprot:10478971-Prorocentrum_lima.AAC.1